jgi:hypothetical protein
LYKSSCSNVALTTDELSTIPETIETQLTA